MTEAIKRPLISKYIKLMKNLSKADDMHDIGLSRHNYHEHNNSELRVLRVMLGNRLAWVWFACTHSTNVASNIKTCPLLKLDEEK